LEKIIQNRCVGKHNTYGLPRTLVTILPKNKKRTLVITRVYC